VILNTGGNKIITKENKHLDFFRFLQLAPNMKNLNISTTFIPTEILAGLFEYCSKLETLDLSDNSLGDNGVIELIQALKTHTTLKHLTLDRNFDKITKQRAKAIQDLAIFLGSEQCKIESLCLVGSAKAALRADIMPMIFSLMTNKTLKLLDISSNQIGNVLGLALSKALQTNKTLESLYWDENGVSLAGYQMFRIGLSRNTTLKVMPIPTLDISFSMREKPSPQLADLAKEFQSVLQANTLAAVAKSQPSRESSTRKLNSAQQISAQVQTGLQQMQAPPVRKNRGKPLPGVDANHASKLFGELHDFLATASSSEELSPEEVEVMKQKLTNSSSTTKKN